MSHLGDNDSTILMWFDGESGNAIDCVGWDEARARIALFLQTDTSATGWAENRAEDLLCSMFSGVAA